MKNINRNTILLTLIAVVLIVFCWVDTRSMDTRSAWGIVAINDEVITDDGHVWGITTDGFKPGERVVVKFNSKGTSQAEDDIILSITKA